MSRYLAALTGLRFLAALHVVLLHLRDPYLVGAPLGLWTIAGQGQTAVGLFFLLSGFVLAHTYLGPDGNALVSRRAFWGARVARIYPVYLLSLLAALPAFLHLSIGERLPQLLLVPTMLQAWLPGYAYQWNGPSWSLSAEAFFYVLFPSLAVPLACLRGPRQLAAAALACWALALAGPLLSHALGIEGPLEGTVLEGARWLTYNPLLRLPEFTLGILLARLAGALGSHPRAARWAPLLATAGAGGLLVAFVVVTDLPPAVVTNGLLAPLDGMLLVGLALGGRGLAWLLAQRAMVLLGEASYALYLLHIPLLDGLRRLGTALPPLERLLATQWFLPVYLTLAISAALAAFVLVERPARRCLRVRLSPPARQVVIPAEAYQAARAPRPGHSTQLLPDFLEASRYHLTFDLSRVRQSARRAVFHAHARRFHHQH